MSVLETVWEEEGESTHELFVPVPVSAVLEGCVGERATTNVLSVPIPVSAALEGCVGERATTDVHLTAGFRGEPGRESLTASGVEFHPGVTIAPSASERQGWEELDEARLFQNWRRF